MTMISPSPTLLLLLFPPTLLLFPTPSASQDFVCDIPTKGCTNGMFNVEKCECECIPPYCPWTDGTCTSPSGNCGGNPWEGCTRGVDCPWWENPLKDESCTTGPVVPPDLWIIYNTRKACCNTNFLYSNICDNSPPAESPPTKYPTISAPQKDDLEVVPIKFDLLRVPDEINIRELKDEMKIVLKRILIKLAERLPDLKITDVEEKAVLDDRKDRNLGKALVNMIRGGGGGGGEGRGKKGREEKKNRAGRGLEQDITVYFNVYVVRKDGMRFGPLIIQELRDSYDDVIVQIKSFTDTKLIGGEDLNLNLCTSESGQFSACLNENTPRPTPPPLALKLPRPPPIRPAMPAPTPVTVNLTGGEEPTSGFPIWMIGLITAGGLVLFCTILCCLFFLCRPSRKDEKEIENNIYVSKDTLDQQGQQKQYPPRPRHKPVEDLQRKDAQRELKKKKKQERRERKKMRRLSSDFNMAPHDYESEEPERPTIEYFMQPQSVTKPTPSVSTAASESVDKSFHVSVGGQHIFTTGVDASYFDAGPENRPDPDSASVRLAKITNGGNADNRYYADDPSTMTNTYPKSNGRDPTMYVDGAQVDPSMHGMESMLQILDGDAESRTASRASRFSRFRDPSVKSKRRGRGGGGGSRASNNPPVGSEGWFNHEGGGGGSHYGYENNPDDPWSSSPEHSFATQPASLASWRSKKSKRSKSNRGGKATQHSFT